MQICHSAHRERRDTESHLPPVLTNWRTTPRPNWRGFCRPRSTALRANPRARRYLQHVPSLQISLAQISWGQNFDSRVDRFLLLEGQD